MTNMRLIFRDDIIRRVPDRWASQYKGYHAADKHDITTALMLLQERGLLTRENIDRTIGNNSWTSNICDECSRDCDILVRIGDEPDYGVQWLDLCIECVSKAKELLIKGATETHTEQPGQNAVRTSERT